MSDAAVPGDAEGAPPTPPAPTPPAPTPPAPPAPRVTVGDGGVVKVRDPVVVVVLSIVTLGIYHLYWIYQVYRELKETQREGIGPVLGLVLAILLGVVNWFVLPSEIGNMYERQGKEKPVRGVTGFWNLIPLVGTIIWLVKVQKALNREWETLGV
jgi:Domain of unknown function (DUF4234)